MRRRAVIVELLLLAFLAVFLLYPLLSYTGGSAREDFAVRLLGLGETPEQKANVIAELTATSPQAIAMRLPYVVQTFPASWRAEALAAKLQKAGAQAEVVRQRHWTAFYFLQALGFELHRKTGFPFVSIAPNNPFLWECLRNSLMLAFATTLVATLVCLPLAYWFTRYQFHGRTGLASLLLVPLIIPPFVGAIGTERLLGRFGTLNLWLMNLGVLDSWQAD